MLGALTAGMVVANIGWRGYISQIGRAHILSFWEYAAFLVNSIVFILIGLQEATRARNLLSLAAGSAIVFVLLSRVVSVYLLCALFHRRRLAVDQRYQHILVWGGLRGALGLAGADDTRQHSGTRRHYKFRVCRGRLLDSSYKD